MIGLVAVGFNFGMVETCFATGAVIGGSSGRFIGGLVGENDVSVSGSYATGAVGGDTYVGGLVGYGGSASTVTTSYAMGGVSGTDKVGGLIGDNAGSLMTSYATGSASGGTSGTQIGGLVGVNEATGSVGTAMQWKRNGQ